MAIIFIGIGGALGSISRYFLGIKIGKIKNIPIGTLIINVTGAFLLGLISNMSMNDNFYLFLTEGFLGAFTTFSAFMYEGVILIKNHEKLNIIIYVIGTLILGLLGFVFGWYILKFF